LCFWWIFTVVALILSIFEPKTTVMADQKANKSVFTGVLEVSPPLAPLHVLWQDSKNEQWVKSSSMKTNETTQLSNNINPKINLYTDDNLACFAHVRVVIVCRCWWMACEWSSDSHIWMVMVFEACICSIACRQLVCNILR
jgi:hypothetical protein